MTVSRYYYYYFSAGAADPPVAAAAGLEINPVFLLAAPGDAETLLANQTYLYAAAAAAVARITFPSSHFSPMWPLLVSSIGYGQRTRTAN